MYTYIKKNIRGFYVELPDILSEAEYDNLGYTYEDFLANKWVLLTEAQVEFKNEHPNASIKQVFDMYIPEPTPHVRTLEEAKNDVLSRIHKYDSSEEVNSFSINNNINVWFTPAERSNYKNSIDSAKVLGIESLSLFIGDTTVTVPTEDAEKMLASVQLYADACFMVTKQHELIVNNMTEIKDVDNYDFTVGYPEKLNFNVSI